LKGEMTGDGERQCSGREVAALSSSSGCMVGQITNVAAFRLAVGGTGRMPCPLAVAASMPASITGARLAKRALVFDGCPARYAMRTMERAGISPTNHVIVTDVGLKNVDDLWHEPSNVDRVVELCLNALSGK